MHIDNPYLREFEMIGGASWMQGCLHELSRNPMTSKVKNYDRHAYCCKYAWAVPDQHALDRITEYSPVCEVGAGTGYWAALLHLNGCDIEAYDLNPVSTGENTGWHPLTHNNQPTGAKDYFPVRKCNEDFVPPENRTLFLCWPPYNNPMAADMVKRYRGDTIIYIGENSGWDSDDDVAWGCTADANFFREVYTVTTWKEIYNYAIPQWDGIHDELFIYRRLT